MLKFFTSTTSPYGRLVHIALREKGFAFELVGADPWTDPADLRAVNPATRVPTLVLDDGSVLTESTLILAWLDAQRPQPALWGDVRCFERAGLAMAVIDAAVHTVITRRVTAPALFDETPIGQRRVRTMADAVRALEQRVARDATQPAGNPGAIDVIASAVALDYLQLRFGDAPWRVATPALDAWLAEVRKRPAFVDTVPR